MLFIYLNELHVQRYTLEHASITPPPLIEADNWYLLLTDLGSRSTLAVTGTLEKGLDSRSLERSVRYVYSFRFVNSTLLPEYTSLSIKFFPYFVQSSLTHDTLAIMVAWFQGPLELHNPHSIDPSAFLVEFDANIPVGRAGGAMPAKLRLDNVHRLPFPYRAIIHVVAAVSVSGLVVIMRFIF